VGKDNLRRFNLTIEKLILNSWQQYNNQTRSLVGDADKFLVDTYATESGKFAHLPLCYSDAFAPTEFSGDSDAGETSLMIHRSLLPNSCGGYTTPYTSQVLDHMDMGITSAAYLSGDMEYAIEYVSPLVRTIRS
jgi:hypothetical protein